MRSRFRLPISLPGVWQNSSAPRVPCAALMTIFVLAITTPAKSQDIDLSSIKPGGSVAWAPSETLLALFPTAYVYSPGNLAGPHNGVAIVNLQSRVVQNIPQLQVEGINGVDGINWSSDSRRLVILWRTNQGSVPALYQREDSDSGAFEFVAQARNSRLECHAPRSHALASDSRMLGSICRRATDLLLSIHQFELTIPVGSFKLRGTTFPLGEEADTASRGWGTIFGVSPSGRAYRVSAEVQATSFAFSAASTPHSPGPIKWHYVEIDFSGNVLGRRSFDIGQSYPRNAATRTGLSKNGHFAFVVVTEQEDKTLNVDSSMAGEFVEALLVFSATSPESGGSPTKIPVCGDSQLVDVALDDRSSDVRALAICVVRARLPQERTATIVSAHVSTGQIDLIDNLPIGRVYSLSPSASKAAVVTGGSVHVRDIPQ